MNWNSLPDLDRIKKTMELLKDRGISPEYYDTRNQAMNRILELIPPKKKVMIGGSVTLKEIGFIDFLKNGKHQWKNIKDEMMSEKNPVKQLELRRASTISDYFLGSVHAVTESGEIIVASESGSQIPSYAYSSPNVIWVVGTQKLVSDLNEGLKRVREHCLPLLDNRMKSLGFGGSVIGKILIIEQETIRKNNVTLIFVNEKLGF